MFPNEIELKHVPSAAVQLCSTKFKLDPPEIEVSRKKSLLGALACSFPEKETPYFPFSPEQKQEILCMGRLTDYHQKLP